ncbi:hypothetical protein E1A91_A01G224700v1 [Gossypium mustelinum]|uniref:Uncharacterized protein n=1 Tax=Gossypium mustelinum TaxID=34275 RepID=A0A5D3AIN4_GOSMU|nr:hypothetical protein E1A91_A01G224700v1 [Gossypium mustelinum]
MEKQPPIRSAPIGRQSQRGRSCYFGANSARGGGFRGTSVLTQHVEATGYKETLGLGFGLIFGPLGLQFVFFWVVILIGFNWFYFSLIWACWARANLARYTTFDRVGIFLYVLHPTPFLIII